MSWARKMFYNLEAWSLKKWLNIWQIDTWYERDMVTYLLVSLYYWYAAWSHEPMYAILYLLHWLRLANFSAGRIMIIRLSISLNMCFGCSKETSHWDGSFEHPQHLFLYPPQTLFVVGILFSRCPSVSASVRNVFFLNNSKSHCWIFIKPCKHVYICKTNTLDKKVRARGQFY